MVSDLQSGIGVAPNAISGTLYYVTGYTQFSEDVSLQSGNYLAIKIVTDSTADVIARLNGGSGIATVVSGSRDVVFRIVDPANQTITIEVSKGAATVSKTYSLTGIALTQPTT